MQNLGGFANRLQLGTLMNTGVNIPVGKLLSIAGKNNKYCTTILEIESALSIDDSFPAEQNLTAKLISLLELLEHSEKREQWQVALLEIKSAGELRKWDYIAPTGRGGNALGGKFQAYPLPAFFIQPADSYIALQAEGLKALFLAALLQKLPHHELTATSNLLRNAVGPGSKKLKFIKLLPEITDSGFVSYLNSLRNTVNADTLTSDEPNSELLVSITRLLHLVPKPIYRPKPKAIDLPVKPSFPSTGGHNGDDPSKPGNLAIHKFLSTENPKGEPPEFINLFTLTAGTDDLNAEPTPEFEVEQQVQESKFWLTRHEKMVPTDLGRFTMAERLRFVRFIHDKINSDNSTDKLVGGLVGCMFTTGLSLKALLDCSLGDGHAFAQGGIYRRKIRLPQDAFSPSEAQIHDLERFTDELYLQLPEPIASWISSLCTQHTIDTISQSLSTDYESAKIQIYSELDILRKKSRFQRIRPERIPAALAIETTLMFRDPTITFLLASTANQSAPKLNYYVTHSAENLAVLYTQVTNKMVSL